MQSPNTQIDSLYEVFDSGAMMFGTKMSPQFEATTIVTVSDPIHPLESVPVTMYVVVILGLAIGLGQFEQLNPFVGVQV